MRLDRQVIGRDAGERRVVHLDGGDEIVRMAERAVEREDRKREGKLGTAPEADRRSAAGARARTGGRRAIR
ncbi:hypothetical protein GCM10023069_18740 [Shinella granuli]